jgi:hypothetical protein
MDFFYFGDHFRTLLGHSGLSYLYYRLRAFHRDLPHADRTSFQPTAPFRMSITGVSMEATGNGFLRFRRDHFRTVLGHSGLSYLYFRLRAFHRDLPHADRTSFQPTAPFRMSTTGASAGLLGTDFFFFGEHFRTALEPAGLSCLYFRLRALHRDLRQADRTSFRPRSPFRMSTTGASGRLLGMDFFFFGEHFRTVLEPSGLSCLYFRLRSFRGDLRQADRTSFRPTSPFRMSTTGDSAEATGNGFLLFSENTLGLS